MYLTQALVLSVSLATLTMGLPTAQSSSSNGLANPWGVPTNNIVCETPKEASTSIDQTILTTTITQSLNTYRALGGDLQAVPANHFLQVWGGDDSMGVDPNGQKYTVNWAPGCDSAGTILFTPLVMDSATGSLSSTDIVVYSLPVGSSATARYCAVLTDSDAPLEEQITVNGEVNPEPAGYHQCNEVSGP